MHNYQIVLPTLAQLMAFFFDASLQGWVNPDAVINRGLFGERTTGYRRGDLLYVDRYFVGDRRFIEANQSHGETTITCCDRVIFIMQYAGWYTEAAVHMAVKPALLAAYSAREFYGGRGQTGLFEQFRYTNDVQWPGLVNNTCTDVKHPTAIERFRGSESVRDNNGDCGFHEYHGLVLGSLQVE